MKAVVQNIAEEATNEGIIFDSDTLEVIIVLRFNFS